MQNKKAQRKSYKTTEGEILGLLIAELKKRQGNNYEIPAKTTIDLKIDSLPKQYRMLDNTPLLAYIFINPLGQEIKLAQGRVEKGSLIRRIKFEIEKGKEYLLSNIDPYDKAVRTSTVIPEQFFPRKRRPIIAQEGIDARYGERRGRIRTNSYDARYFD